MEILTEREAQILAMSRFILDRVAQRCNDLVSQSMVEEPTRKAISNARDLGFVGGHASEAEYGIFMLLNTASNWTDDPIAKLYVHAKRNPDHETPFGDTDPLEPLKKLREQAQVELDSLEVQHMDDSGIWNNDLAADDASALSSRIDAYDTAIAAMLVEA